MWPALAAHYRPAWWSSPKPPTAPAASSRGWSSHFPRRAGAERDLDEGSLGPGVRTISAMTIPARSPRSCTKP